ncbi:VIT domain-containing protein [Tahibacter caeni]|uniref:VIT domain-containing protein n=1 Tax=Tahibacter caeni TaxID=1453545 RepID=UPI00214889DE|nr:VIT domain-containing protein [Tahibacter caeni]
MHGHSWGWVAGRCLAAWLALTTAAAAAGETPYLQVLGGDPARVERLPLLQTRAEVDIVGTIASVELRQVFENRGDVPIEAVYVFPASTDAAVGSLTLRIGERTVRGVLREKQQARADYDAARSEGRNSALLEQQAEGVFRLRVANILPGDRIDVALQYTELLRPREGVYEFFLPTTRGATAGGESATHDPVRSSAAAEVTDYSFALAARLRGAAPFAAIASPSHRIDVQRSDARRAAVTLAADEAKAATRDFVLRFSYAGDAIADGLQLYPGGPEQFFLLTVQPPASVLPDQVPAREYLFVVDVSGSMAGAPLDLAKLVLRELLAGMRPQDRFNVVLFAGAASVLDAKASLAGTPDNLRQALRFIDAADGSGATDLLSALQTAYALPHGAGVARSVVVVTDGGIAAGDAVSRLIRSRLGEASVFAFGVGARVDKAVIRRIARAGTGEAVMIENLDEGKPQAQAFRRYIEQPLLSGIAVAFEGFDAYDVSPMPVPDLFAQRPVVLVGKYRGAAQGRIRLRAQSGRGPYEAVVDVAAAADVSAENAPLRTLWARQMLADRIDLGAEPGAEDALRREITQLGLDYGLLTPYTAFVAIDDAVRTQQPSTTVDQPLPQRASQVVGYASGSGNALLFAAALSPALQQNLAASAAPLRVVDGRRFRERGDTLVDLAYRDGQPLLRIRRDSPAFMRLLQLRPDLRVWLELEGSVLLSLGRYAVLVDARGFSDYPDALLQRAVALRP